ncbi:hypothetical protein D8Y23_01180 [Microbacterium enclense]|uniref:Uncharacterized protein n=1 Tax=Microbacterium enclense TaxID=993073 RepID=A0A3S3N1W2_9MICO|nr:hypothetical protein [Microbacterium enclense]RWR22831.1 hypothetical protein D8Y23_01180 [Microbacterium enclense]
MTERPISIRAQVALADLAVILHGGTRDDVDRWATKYSWSDSKRDVGVLVALTELAARAHPGENENETGGSSLAAQLIAAQRAGDDPVIDALVQIWVESPPPTRAEVLHELIRFLSR